LEVPSPEGDSWQQQIHTLRKLIRAKVGDDRQGERFAALKAVADLESWVSATRHASAITSHASQGSTVGTVFPATELLWGQGDARALTYVAFSRASHRVELLDQGAEFRVPI
jgi:ATP-dependent exoDNAse (exonuclease V) alpha subunit